MMLLVAISFLVVGLVVGALFAYCFAYPAGVKRGWSDATSGGTEITLEFPDGTCLTGTFHIERIEDTDNPPESTKTHYNGSLR